MSTKFCQWIVIVGLGAALAACSSKKTVETDKKPDTAPTAQAGTDSVPPTAANEPVIPTTPADTTTPPPAAPGTPEAAANTTPAVPTPAAPTTDAAANTTPAPATPDANTSSAAPTTTTTTTEAAANTTPAAPEAASAPAPATASGSYTVQSGDTLMKIAFENYGDLFKWRSIYEANREKIKDPNHVPPGTVLTLDSTVSPVTVSHNGQRYEIKTGDTLGSISDDVYGTKRKWRRLWDNNKELIHDPNHIFAGFSLYYTFTDQDRVEFEQLKGQSKPAPLAKTTGADQESPRAPASVDEAGSQAAPAN